MRRRDTLAGLASLGVLAGGGIVAVRGLPSIDSDPSETNAEDTTGDPEQFTIETAEAQGSEAGEIDLPALDQPTFIDFFGTWCPPCI